MDWKQFVIRLIEALRWPAAFLAAVVILREPIWRLIGALAAGSGTR